MITLITGCAGTGKTLAALNFAQEPGTLFFAGDESPDVLRTMAFNHRLDVSNTRFAQRPPILDLHTIVATVEQVQKSTPFTRLVIEDIDAVQEIGFGRSRLLIDVANKYGLHILGTVQTRRALKELDKDATEDEEQDYPRSLDFIASNHICLDRRHDSQLRGVLIKRHAQLEDPLQKLGAMFGMELRKSRKKL